MTNEFKIVTLVGVLMAILVVGLGYFASKSTADQPSTRDVTSADLSDAGEVIRDTTYSRGDENAKVRVVEFGDFQCPACASVEPSLASLIQSYAGKGVDFSFRNFPLSQHDNAQLAATAAEAAGEQGKYWEMHDMLYAAQTAWTSDAPASKSYDEAKEIFKGYAQQLGLDMAKYNDAVDNRKFNDKIAADMADADALGVSSTPTLFVNGMKVESIAVLQQAIEAELAK